MVKEDGSITFYDGKIRIGDATGNLVADGLDATRYSDYLGEKVEPWSYLKSAYYKPKGYPDGMYRVGPLARLNVVDRCGTERADQELAEFKELQRAAVLSSFHYHQARLIEILYCVETAGTAAERPGNTFETCSRRGEAQCSGGRWSIRSPSRHLVPSLQD